MGRALASLSLSWVVCACGSRACLHVGMSGSCMQFQRFSPVLPAAPSEYRSLSWNQLVAWQRDTTFWSSGAPASCLPEALGGEELQMSSAVGSSSISPRGGGCRGGGLSALQILLLGHRLPWEGCSYTCSVGQFLRPPGSRSPLALLPFSSGTPLAKGTNSQTVPAATRRSHARQMRGLGRTRTAARSAVPAPPPPPTRKTGSSATAATVSSSATTR